MTWWCRLFHYKFWRDISAYARAVELVGVTSMRVVGTTTSIRCTRCRRVYGVKVIIPASGVHNAGASR